VNGIKPIAFPAFDSVHETCEGIVPDMSTNHGVLETSTISLINGSTRSAIENDLIDIANKRRNSESAAAQFPLSGGALSSWPLLK
jgi:hypothetical protein